MNKNEFAENLVKEFSVKHPNYSASVKKPEEEPVTDDVCAMWSYVKKKYKLNTTNFLFLCNC